MKYYAVIDTFHQCALYIDAEPIDIELLDSKDCAFYEVVMEEKKRKVFI